ncbi:probable dehydrin LEA [Musa acuminata AAA Group]|uniref:probable dehydrin LEA n=1 Tax=Musa acuminata AAA Group TaxID=214697 RepID=UPI0031D9F514
MSAEREEHGDQIRRTDECGDAAREVIAGSMEHHGASLSEMLRRSGGSGSNSPGYVEAGRGREEAARKEKLRLRGVHKREERGSTVGKHEKKGFMERLKDRLLGHH